MLKHDEVHRWLFTVRLTDKNPKPKITAVKLGKTGMIQAY